MSTEASYTVVEESSPAKLSATVSTLMNLGWAPVGGVAAWCEEGKVFYAQALLQRAKEVPGGD